MTIGHLEAKVLSSFAAQRSFLQRKHDLQQYSTTWPTYIVQILRPRLKGTQLHVKFGSERTQRLLLSSGELCTSTCVTFFLHSTAAKNARKLIGLRTKSIPSLPLPNQHGNSHGQWKATRHLSLYLVAKWV